MHVVSGSLDTSIRVWDVDTGTCKHALMGHQSLTSGEISQDTITLHSTSPVGVSGMELKDNILVSGNADSTVKIWDILTGQCLQTLSGEPTLQWIVGRDVNIRPQVPTSTSPR